MPAADDLVLAIDQGTSSTKVLAVDSTGAIVARGRAPLGISYPAPGWVQQSPDDIWTSVQQAVADCLATAPDRQVVAVGLSTQRESITLWEHQSGRPVGPMLGWQDRRTGAMCRELEPAAGQTVRELSGLPLDPMFSAAKAKWLLDEHDPDRTRASAGELRLGTVDSWLLRCLTGVHQVEAGNASRTQLLDVRSGRWSPELLDIFAVPEQALPEVVPSVGEHFGEVRSIPELSGVPVTAVLADSHAALFAHGAFTPGPIKATYGTGSSVIGLIGSTESVPDSLCLTIAWQLGEIAHAVEGNIQSTGATLTWLATVLDLTPSELVAMAERSSSDGVVLIPAFDGLGAPWWDSRAVALFSGLTLSSSREQLARAALESVAAQVADVAREVVRTAGSASQPALLADGGVSASDVVMQLQADLLGIPVERAVHPELSALGAAHLAGVGAGVWTLDDLQRLPRERDVFTPAPEAKAADELAQRWSAALRRSRLSPQSPTTEQEP